MIFGLKSDLSIIFLILLCLCVNAQKYSEYEVKAVYLEKFTRFVDWPEEARMGDVDLPFILGVFGSSPFDTILENTFAGQKIKNKSVEIRYFSSLNEVVQCNLLFICGSEYRRIDQILEKIKDLPILTVCDDTRFYQNGVQITLFLEDNHVYFKIDPEAVKLSGLYMNSMLLNLSRP